jgi:hypothetical protein
VTIFDYGKIEGLKEDEDRLFIAMEYLSGETLPPPAPPSSALAEPATRSPVRTPPKP